MLNRNALFYLKFLSVKYTIKEYLKYFKDENEFMSKAKERIKKLRKLMKEKNIDVCYIPTSDFHDSEYISDYFKCREYVSGFTGSAGTLIVGLKESGLFTDGRYYIQAEKELEGSGIKLFKAGEPDCISEFDYMEMLTPDNGCIAFDGRLVNAEFVRELIEELGTNNLKIKYNTDLVGKIWKDRPKQVFNEIFYLEEKYSGESVNSKLERLRKAIAYEGAEAHILSSLDDIAWLFNIRSSDIESNPVAQAFAVIFSGAAYLFIGTDKISKRAKDELKKAGVEIRKYDEIYSFVRNEIEKDEIVYLDASRVNYRLLRSLRSREFVDAPNPTSLFKAIKNETEIKNLKKAHIKDGVAVTKFMYWLKNEAKLGKIREADAAAYIDDLRSKLDNYYGPSFETISAYKENAAMMHYNAERGNNAILKKEGMLLVDSGGQYLEGTTDITRTFALGKVNAKMKKHYTLVLKGMLALANAKFLYGCSGLNLDILARGPLWEIGEDYKCGTGHGVGCFLSVHEGPNNFRYKNLKGKDATVLEEGMVTTDEPGSYIEGEFGIRIENELLCVEDRIKGSDRFMKFEVLTMAPIDLDLVDEKYLDERSKLELNKYNALVYKNISPYLDEKEKKWLKCATKAI